MRNQLFASLGIIAMLSACAQQGGGYGQPNSAGQGDIFSKQNIGTVIGAAGGAVAGSQFGKGNGKTVAVALGTLLGAGLGNSVGKSLDNADISAYNTTSQHAMEQGQPGQSFPWSNPQSGNHGTVTPKAYYQTADGTYCREYTQSINIGGQVQSGVGKACRQPDGSWQIVQ